MILFKRLLHKRNIHASKEFLYRKKYTNNIHDYNIVYFHSNCKKKIQSNHNLNPSTSYDTMEQDGAWCIKDNNQVWWIPIFDSVIKFMSITNTINDTNDKNSIVLATCDINHKNNDYDNATNIFTYGNMKNTNDGFNKELEFYLSKDFNYHDSFISNIADINTLYEYLNHKSNIYKLSNISFNNPIFYPRLIGAERNVFHHVNGHVTNQIKCDLILSYQINLYLYKPINIKIPSVMTICFNDLYKISKLNIKHKPSYKFINNIDLDSSRSFKSIKYKVMYQLIKLLYTFKYNYLK